MGITLKHTSILVKAFTTTSVYAHPSIVGTLVSEQDVCPVCSCHTLVLTSPSVTHLTVAWCQNEFQKRPPSSQSLSAEPPNNCFRTYGSTVRSNSCPRCI
ncbi:hypothetical protein DPMN_011300 [Dreissena polymorpha]|uniref:Uncharacterized protein n=1 Tax=Dreissena polymorpha TaxID=45954 RepID=A0A9D4N4S8_DREPO|nr:hypothetical protein DPMN_011300 [Dreissena polymorpha]